VPTAEEREDEDDRHGRAEELTQPEARNELGLLLAQRPQQHALNHGRRQVDTLSAAPLAGLAERHGAPHLLHHVTQGRLVHL
jgi:hypothetical protein